MRRGSLKGFEGSITRVVKEKGGSREFFIKGTPDTTFKDALIASWPFKDRDVKDTWKVLTQSGEDVTDKQLSLQEGTVIIEFS